METKNKLLIGGGIFLTALLIKKNMTINKSALDIIKESEGFSNKAYKDSTGILTIGYGTTANVKPDDVITKQQAENFLIRDAKTFGDIINKNVKRKLTKNQFSALLSLVYNIGGGAFQKSTLLKKLNAGATVDELRPHWLAWRNAGGKPILLSRRQKEFDIFTS